MLTSGERTLSTQIQTQYTYSSSFDCLPVTIDIRKYLGATSGLDAEALMAENMELKAKVDELSERIKDLEGEKEV